jgi:hypothetical protein
MVSRSRSRWLVSVVAASILLCLLSGCGTTSDGIRSARPNSQVNVGPVESAIKSPSHDVTYAEIEPYEVVDQQLHRGAWQTEQYQAMEAEVVRSLAAANSWLAQQMVWERNLLDACPSEEDTPCQQETLRQILSFRESHERNQAADDALESFYSLAETQAALATIQHSLKNLDRVEQRVAELQQAEIAVPIDTTELARQRSELTDQQIDLRLVQMQLNVKLRGHVGDGGDSPLWSVDDWTFTAGRLDLGEHVGNAMQYRADLGGLQWVAHEAAPDALHAMEKALSWMDPALGLSAEKLSLCSLIHAGEPDCCRFTNRRGQIQDLSASYGDVVSQQVQLAALNVEGKQRQVALAAERLKSWETREGVLEEKQQINQASFFEVEEARAKRIEAKGVFLAAIIQWRASQAKLQAAEGRLGSQPLRSGER